MQRQFTLELRVDYTDDGKNEVMQQAIQAAARHILAQATLLSDGVKPQIACFSDNWYTGVQDINILDDVIQQGLDHAAASGDANDQSVSSELLAAAQEMRR